MKARPGRTPDVLRKGGPMRDRTRYHRPSEPAPELLAEDAPRTVEALTRRLHRSDLANQKLKRRIKRLEARIYELEAQVDFLD